MRRAARLALVVLAAACSPGRSFRLQFSSVTPDDPDLARIARVELQVFDGAACTCIDLDQKAGCMSADRVGEASFAPDSARQSLGGLPEGAVVLRVRALDAAAAPIPLKFDCLCVPEGAASNGVLTLPLGTPYNPRGVGCGM